MPSSACRSAAREDGPSGNRTENLHKGLCLTGRQRHLDEIGVHTDEQLDAARRRPILVEAALAMQRGDLTAAEARLTARLTDDPADIAALRMLAEVATRVGRLREAQGLLERALALAPDFTAARANYATVLHRQNRLGDALTHVDRVLADAPGDPGAQALKAAILARANDTAGAIALYADILARFPAQPRLWMSYGHALKTIGRQADSIAAYRRAIGLAPSLGEAWWSLANLKTVRFTPADIAAMRAAITGRVVPADRYHLDYALGKACEDAGDWAAAFAHYAAGAALRRRELPYDAAETTRHVAASRRLLTREAFAARPGGHVADPVPIFVVGLPRAGSTLVEQILASHSAVEGTAELPELGGIAGELADRDDAHGDGAATSSVDAALRLDAAGRADLGRRYIERTRLHRKTDRPFFIDKMPNNWAHVGLIHLILPNAIIVDARRDPAATCFSCFKQHFSRGQGFTYDLTDLGRYWRDYAELMAHIDTVLPGRVVRVFHETLVDRPETEIRRLLDRCGLGFEPACVAFHANDRPVRTASSEQVRRPINRDGLDRWRRFAPWLEELSTALGDAPTTYAAMAADARHGD